jgi:transcription antitermination factor NusG
MTEQWYIAEVSPNREAMVAFTIRCMGLEPFLPLLLQTERISPRTRQKELTARPTLPGYVFFKTEPQYLSEVNAIRDLRGIVKGAGREFITVPPRQMVPFMIAHDQWHIEAREAYRRGRQIRSSGPKPKFQAMTKDVLEEFMRTHFRLSEVELAEVA